eukprot:TRINITY_DN692_c0_g1_i16.p1 TRINITY_DN692_c0_g1~~TRINITY_DN692_c0_g1_i16.p1  ORF type:complete len:375 (-),score=45.41 TRINITY_DN692_c0_g1_i16:57-1181(-)
MTERSSVSISDNTLREQADLKIKPEKEKMKRLLQALETTDEGMVVQTCDTLAHVIFIPWLSKQNQANKLYFAKKGGVSRCVRWMKEGTHVETQAYAGTAIWNFAESGTMHEILWKHGAVDALLMFLKSDNIRLQRVAVGALFGLLDYDSHSGAHLAVDYDKELVRKLVEMKHENPSWSFILAKTGCLLSLAKQQTTRAEILAAGGLQIFKEQKEDSLINYLNALGLAHLIAGDTEIEASEKQKCIDLIARQCSAPPRAIRLKESQHGLVWTSVNHHLRLMRDKLVIVRQIALFSLANMSHSDYNRSLMIEENIVDDIACLEWRDDGQYNDRKRALLNTIWSNLGFRPVPSLFNITMNHIHLYAPHLLSETTHLF